MALQIATPQLSEEGIVGPKFTAEKAINLLCASAAFSDGTIVVPESAQLFGFQMYRENQDTSVQVWDEANKEWVAESTVTEPAPLGYQDGAWKMIIAAMGQPDKNGTEKFATDMLTTFPRYFTRCQFSATDATGVVQEGLSAASSAVEIYAVGVSNRAGLITDPEKPADAEEIRLFLKDGALVAEQASLKLFEQDGGFAAELQTSGASITINKDGDIILQPKSGRSAQINGDLAVTGNVQFTGNVNVVGLMTLNGRSVATV